MLPVPPTSAPREPTMPVHKGYLMIAASEVYLANQAAAAAAAQAGKVEDAQPK